MQINYGKMDPQQILMLFPLAVQRFLETGELDGDLYEALFESYVNSNEMPYGVAKARSGDPYEWVAERVKDLLV